MPCTACKRDKPIVAKGFCEACYRRQRRHGTTEYLRIGRQTPCSVNGCEGRAISNGLCDKHRKRLARLGHTGIKHESWGAIAKHPLRGSVSV